MDSSRRKYIYEIIDNAGKSELCQYDKGEHRLFYEFKEFTEIIEKRDVKRAEEMLEISLTATEIMQEARRQQKIIFEGEDIKGGVSE